jgi:prepilin-type N-terminal cleavage/methylation domain-containing protein
MRKDQGFSLIELLIVVAIIAIIAAIAVPSMLQARMAANESSGIQSCRTAGSAEVAYAAINNQTYTDVATLISGGFLDSRFTNGINGYAFTSPTTLTGVTGLTLTTPDGFAFLATPAAGKGRYIYGVGPDQVVRYEGAISGATAQMCGAAACTAGDPIGSTGGSGS